MGAGVLHAAAAATRFGLARHEPPADLAAFVEFFWVVRWDLRGEQPHEQAILPHPNVNLAFESAGAAVFGVDRKIFTRRLSGTGKALGVRFRPGGFRPFYSAPIFTLNDRVVPARGIFGPSADRTCEAVMAAASDVGQLAGACGIPERRLQRLFADYVGVSPKWVMRRARLHEAALRAESGGGVDWAALAADLGYADQAHLTRDFTATLGVPPAQYAAR